MFTVNQHRNKKESGISSTLRIFYSIKSSKSSMQGRQQRERRPQTSSRTPRTPFYSFFCTPWELHCILLSSFCFLLFFCVMCCVGSLNYQYYITITSVCQAIIQNIFLFFYNIFRLIFRKYSEYRKVLFLNIRIFRVAVRATTNNSYF